MRAPIPALSAGAPAVKRLSALLARLPVGDLARRALDETVGDWRYEQLTATDRRSIRPVAFARMLVALARVLAASFGSLGESPMRHLGRDAFYAWRRLKASPVFTLFSILTLALGIGATTGVYSFVRAATAPPSGVEDVGALLHIDHYAGGGMPMRTISRADFLDLRARQTTMTDVMAWTLMRQMLMANRRTHEGFGEIVSANYFDVLGVRPALGRLLQPRDDDPGAPPVAVLGHRTWLRLFDGRSDAVGETVLINGHTFEIVGVAPASFKGLFNGGLVSVPAWVPLGAAALFPETGIDRPARDDRSLLVRGRLRPDRTQDQVRAEVAAIGAQLDTEYPFDVDLGGRDRRRLPPYHFSRAWSVEPLVDTRLNAGATELVDGLAAAVLIAMGLVLLVACTNLANLSLARGAARRQEQAVRMALGASRWRLVREGLTETGLIALAGGLAGVGVARVVMISIGQEIPVGNVSLLVEPALDLAALAVAAGATILALVVAGLVPWWQSSRATVRETLAAGSSSYTALPRWRGRRLLIAAQVAVSVVLVGIAAVFVAQIAATSRLDGGYDLDRLAVAALPLSLQGLDDDRAETIATQALARLVRTPGIESAAVSAGLPVGIRTTYGYLRRDENGDIAAASQYVAATPGIFRTLGVSMVRGRAFDERDMTGADPVVVVNETTARAMFERTDVVGQSIVVQRQQWVGGPTFVPRRYTIIGVAEATDAGSVGRRDADEGVIYVPFARDPSRSLVFAVRTGGDPADAVRELRAALVDVAPDVAIGQIGTGRRLLGPSSLFGQVTASVSGLLGGFALVLALAGLYGVLSHVVARRTREIGVRIALGGTRAAIRRLILREGMSPVVIGVAAGASLAVIARLSLRPLFAQLVPAADPFALAIVPALLLAAGAFACYLPARRAAAVDPNVALRD